MCRVEQRGKESSKFCGFIEFSGSESGEQNTGGGIALVKCGYNLMRLSQGTPSVKELFSDKW